MDAHHRHRAASATRPTSSRTADGEAVVIDPPRDAWRIAAAAAERAAGGSPTSSRPTSTTTTCPGPLELRAAHGVGDPGAGRGRLRLRPPADGRRRRAGRRRPRAARPARRPATPPSTWPGTSRDADAPGGDPLAVATGGSLLSGSAGRTDLLGAEQTDALTAAQCRTPARAGAPCPTVTSSCRPMAPAASAGPDRPGASGSRRSAASAATTRSAGRSTDDALRGRPWSAGFGPYPTYYREMAPLNRAGPAVLGGARRPAPPRWPGSRAPAMADGARHVVDAAAARRFAAGHIPGSLEHRARRTRSRRTSAGSCRSGRRSCCVLPDPLEDAPRPRPSTSSLRIGYDDVVGVARRRGRGVAAAGGDELATYPIDDRPRPGGAEAAASAASILDVRDPRRVARGRGHPGRAGHPASASCRARLAELPPGSP